MLVPITVIDSGPKLSFRDQWSGASESRWVRLDTPHGTVTWDGMSFRMYRPRFGLRLRDRTVLLEAPTVQMASVMNRWGTFDIVDRRAGDVVLRSAKTTLIDADLDPTAMVLAIAFERCGIVQTSTFLNGLTF